MHGKTDVPDDGNAEIAESDVFETQKHTFFLSADAVGMDRKLAKAERLRERLKSASPAACAKLTERLVRLLDELAQ